MNEESKNARILIVDDTRKNLELLGTILLQEGYQINAGSNGLRALEVAEKVSPDLILLDIMMPEMDGFETCKRLKASEKTKAIPVIFLTARTDSDDIVKGFQLGAVDYITKPFNPTELLVRVRTHLELKLSKDLLEKEGNERKELLHVLCHDLSNPFNAILSSFHLIEEGFSTFDGLKEHLHAATQSGLEVIQLVRNMRALEERKLELRNINLSEAVSQSFFLLKNQFSGKDIELDICIDHHLNVRAESASFINSVLNNILTNAVKFSHRGSKILMSARETGDDVKISIRDFGIGMSEKLQNEIFDLSKKTSRPGTEDEIGTGFGMLLIKKFVIAYGGEIEVRSKTKEESPRDHGTEIILRLQKAYVR